MGSLTKAFKNRRVRWLLAGRETLSEFRRRMGRKHKRLTYMDGRRPLERCRSKAWIKARNAWKPSAETMKKLMVFMAPYPDESRGKALGLVTGKKQGFFTRRKKGRS